MGGHGQRSRFLSQDGGLRYGVKVIAPFGADAKALRGGATSRAALAGR